MPECFTCNGGDLPQHTRECIERVGVSIVSTQIEVNGGYLNMTYSVGLTETYKQPELIIFGLRPQTAALFINIYADMLKEGKTFKEDKEYLEFSDYPSRFKNITKNQYVKYLKVASEFNIQNNNPLEAKQWLFPDSSGKWSDLDRVNPGFASLVYDLALEDPDAR